MKNNKILTTFYYLLIVGFLLNAIHLANAMPPDTNASVSGEQVTASYTKSIISTSCWSNNQVIATPTQQNALAIYENYVYVTYYNTDRYLCVSRSSDYGKGDWKTVVLSHRYEMRNGEYDSHNTPNIAISPKDKRIHLSFDMHARDLRYIISAENLAVAPDSVFTADQFSATRDYITEAKTKITSVTYPRFILGNDSTLLFAYRGEGGSGNANNFLASYKNDGYWNTPIKIVNGKTGTYSGTAGTTSSRCAYFNDFVFKSGVLYLTWTWRETPDGGTNHDVMFAYSEDNGVTWKNTNNEALELPIHLNSKDINVATVPQGAGLINHNGCALDALGNVHAVMRMGSVYQHFYRIGTEWKSQAVSGVSVGDRPKLYCGDLTNTLYLVARSGGEVSLYASDNSNDWQTWTKVKGVSDDYMCATNSFISSDGKTLRTMAVTSDNELHLITWNLDTPQADTTRYLFFSNLSDGQQIETGTSLSVEASVGSAFKEVSLWSGTTYLGTKTSAPYVWFDHAILTEMSEPSYTFKLVAKDSNNVEVEKVISITTDAPSAHKFSGEGQYTFYNPSKTKWMGYDVATDDALVTDTGDADINKLNVLANGDKFNIFTGDYQKVVIINAASGYTSMLADTTAEVLASNDALFSFTETGQGTELYFIASGDAYKLNVKSGGDDIGRGTSELPNYQWQLTRIGNIIKDPDINVEGVVLDQSSVELTLGESSQLIATVSPDDATNKTLSWNTGDASIATVDENGLISAVAAGTTSITVITTDGSFTAECTVTVSEIAVTGVTLDKTSVALVVDETSQLTATVNPSNANNKTVIWSSANDTIATVNVNGLVTALSVGTTTITVATVDGDFTADCAINVTSTVGIGGLTATKHISVYPNPTNGEFTISSDLIENAEVTVCTLSGKIIFQKQASGKTMHYSGTQLQKGVYLILVKGVKQAAFVEKLIVK